MKTIIKMLTCVLETSDWLLYSSKIYMVAVKNPFRSFGKAQNW